MDPCREDLPPDPSADDVPEFRLGMAPVRDVFLGIVIEPEDEEEPNPFPDDGGCLDLRGMVIGCEGLPLTDLRRGMEPSKDEALDFFFGMLQLLDP
mmetsp:Transcript_3595/g.10159  ORF Transcript_3595/g.10159 Transcript_3595/m.10159 type:complete len:96 (-) Transcript_3595:305-592(-)